MTRDLLRDDIILAVFELAEFAMSAEELERTFNLDSDCLEQILERLEEGGYLEHFGRGYYKTTAKAEERVSAQMRVSG